MNDLMQTAVAAVFDFDGVFVPSPEIKRAGYRRMFSDYGEDVPEFEIRASLERFKNAKGDRHDVIGYVLEQLGRADEAAEYVRRYGEIVSREINALAVEQDAIAMLERLHGRCSLYINSNTPDDPLRQTLQKLGIAPYFKGVYGSSLGKAATLRKVMEVEGVGPARLIYVGDEEGDRLAAEEVGCMFVGIASDGGWAVGTDRGFPVIASVGELDPSDRGHVV